MGLIKFNYIVYDARHFVHISTFNQTVVFGLISYYYHYILITTMSSNAKAGSSLTSLSEASPTPVGPSKVKQKNRKAGKTSGPAISRNRLNLYA